MTEPVWVGKWIWSGEAAASNSYRIFRRAFEWPAEKSCMPTAYISADYQYKLYLNGRLVTNGPAPSTRLHQTYDIVPITLTAGEANVITIVVSYPGVELFSGYRNRGGLLFQMDNIVSDASWLVAIASPWDAASQRISVQQGFAEYYDAREEPQGAFGGDIIGDEWRSAEIVCDADGGAWPTLEARDIPQPEFRRRDRELRMIEWGNCTPGAGETVSRRMQDEQLRPLTKGLIKRGSERSDPVEIVPGTDDLYVTYDFGQEVSGFVKLCVEGENDGAVLDLGYDEILRVGSFPSGMMHTQSSCEINYADQVTLRHGVTVFRGFAPRAFRYMRIAFRGLVAPLTIHFVTLVESTYPVNRLGSFACSDARLEQIWEVGRRTLQLCMDDRYMDCPWRERAQWVGDARVEAIAAAFCFGDTLLHRRFLRQIGESQYPDGRTDPVGPGEWDGHRVNSPIHGFTALWIASIWDYYQLTADGDVPASLLPAIIRAIDWLGSFGTAPGGLLCDAGNWNFTDWADGLVDMPKGIAAPVNLFYIDALRVASAIAMSNGDDTLGVILANRRSAAAAAFADLFWSEERGVFLDHFVDDEFSTKASQHTNCLALLFDVGTPEQQASIETSLLNDATLTQVGSPYFSYYLLAALYKIGLHDEALSFIRDKWGAMLDSGATSWWETFGADTSSHCHAWSIGPTIDLLTEYVGISPAEPGFALVRVAPHVSDLKWAKGVVPIPGGDVVCSWHNTAERFTLDISTPVGIHIQPVLPAAAGDTILIDGEVVTEDAITRRTGATVELCVMPGSGYRFEVIRHTAPG